LKIAIDLPENKKYIFGFESDVFNPSSIMFNAQVLKIAVELPEISGSFIGC
jgi:hypothetical protein